jgi:hypothetical protein
LIAKGLTVKFLLGAGVFRGFAVWIFLGFLLSRMSLGLGSRDYATNGG